MTGIFTFVAHDVEVLVDGFLEPDSLPLGVKQVNAVDAEEIVVLFLADDLLLGRNFLSIIFLSQSRGLVEDLHGIRALEGEGGGESRKGGDDDGEGKADPHLERERSGGSRRQSPPYKI